MNRIKEKLKSKRKILSIYFTAGYPELRDTVGIIQALEANGVDMIEIGLPFSDPLADGPTIQESSAKALKNGMTTELLFRQLKDIRSSVTIPLVLMGYFNPILQYGVEKFCEHCRNVGIDGLILPDLPLDVYLEEYQTIFSEQGLICIFLISPQTSDSRIREIDRVSDGFIYMVSSASTTGSNKGFGKEQTDYFERVAAMDLKNPLVVGFGIDSAGTFEQATAKTTGAIIGSAFIRHLTDHGPDSIADFIKRIR